MALWCRSAQDRDAPSEYKGRLPASHRRVSLAVRDSAFPSTSMSAQSTSERRRRGSAVSPGPFGFAHSRLRAAQSWVSMHCGVESPFRDGRGLCRRDVRTGQPTADPSTPRPPAAKAAAERHGGRSGRDDKVNRDDRANRRDKAKWRTNRFHGSLIDKSANGEGPKLKSQERKAAVLALHLAELYS
jgi:hypothetical protein